jgi:4-hydroxy-tetrahydrodipicolinate reductase
MEIPMKIALIGYGKMGRAIEEVALGQGHHIVLRIGTGNRSEMTGEALRQADVAIEFSRPDAAFANLEACFRAGVPVVCGTTAWLERLEEAKQLCAEHEGSLFYAANYSIGVNLLFSLNRRLAALMEGQSQYDVHIEEIHHLHKLDAPSGTAIRLAQDILALVGRKNTWTDQETAHADEIRIEALREGNFPGTHSIRWESPVDEIELRHVAKNRLGFARGALQAAHWLVGKKGYFEMSDLLGL